MCKTNCGACPICVPNEHIEQCVKFFSLLNVCICPKNWEAIEAYANKNHISISAAYRRIHGA